MHATYSTPVWLRQQTGTFMDDGFEFLPQLLGTALSRRLAAELPRLEQATGDAMILEDADGRVRKVFGVHFLNREFDALARSELLLTLVQTVLGPSVYLFRTKVNFKKAQGGDGFGWHQDYPHWKDPGQLPDQRALSLVVFLDDVNEDNGPIQIMRGSQVEAPQHRELDPRAARRLADRYPLVAPLGGAGSVLLIHARAIHGSGKNNSLLDRPVAVFTYAADDNRPPRDSAVPIHLADGRGPVFAPCVSRS